MSIDNFKNIEERKGYLVETEDRKIFEKEIGKSFFGAGIGDMIEFILYDSSDNQLPQGDSGKLVRYINLNDSNISEYFLISNNQNGKKLNDASEFVVDIEKLIREAGYSNGIFKTQVTLLNKRIGIEDSSSDKLWIHEISPSRTEIRVLPIKNKGRGEPELLKRYETFTQNGNFRDDTIYFAKAFIEGIDVQLALENFLKSKGRVSDGRTYIELIKQEFKISNFEKLLVDIKEKFVESMNYYIDGYEWSITSNRYGKPKSAVDLVELSIGTIESTALQSLLMIIDYFLPRRDIQEQSILSKEQKKTIDQLKKILKSNVSNSTYQSTTPESVSAQVRGCTDKNAENYNPAAEIEDGTCRYKQQDINDVVPKTIPGCTDKNAINYNPSANRDNGTCKYPLPEPEEDDPTPPPPPIPTNTKRYYVWSDVGYMTYKDAGGVERRIKGREYDDLGIITCQEGSKQITGDIRNIPKVRPRPKVIKEYRVQNLSKPTYDDVVEPRGIYYNDAVYDEFAGDLSNGGRGNYSDNFRYGYGGENFRQNDANDFRRFTQPVRKLTSPGRTLTFSYKDKSGARKSKSVSALQTVLVCAEIGSIQVLPDLKITVAGNCGDTPPPPPIPIPDSIPGPIPPPPPPPPKPLPTPIPEIIRPIPPVLPPPPPTPIPIRSTPPQTITRGGGGGRGSRAVFDEGPRPGRRSDDLYSGPIELEIGRDIK